MSIPQLLVEIFCRCLLNPFFLWCNLPLLISLVWIIYWWKWGTQVIHYYCSCIYLDFFVHGGFFVVVVCFVILWFELRALCLLDRHSTTLVMLWFFVCCFSYSWDRVYDIFMIAFIPRWHGLDCDPHIYALVGGKKGAYYTLRFFLLLRWRLTKFLPKLILNHYPPNLCLLSS
jgi:hypothetical protein